MLKKEKEEKIGFRYNYLNQYKFDYNKEYPILILIIT
jgi:hypothetical protein